MNDDQIKGRVKEAAGKAQKNLGDAIDSPEQQGKGMAREIKGKVQKNYGDAKDATRDSIVDAQEERDDLRNR